MNSYIYNQREYYLLKILRSIIQSTFIKVGTSIVSLISEFHNESQPVHYFFANLKVIMVQ